MTPAAQAIGLNAFLAVRGPCRAASRGSGGIPTPLIEGGHSLGSTRPLQRKQPIGHPTPTPAGQTTQDAE